MVAQSSTTSSPPRGRRSGSTRSRKDILKAARTLFAEGGFEGTSLRSIASQAGVDPALIRYFFGSKEALFLILLKEVTPPPGQTPIPPAVGANDQGVAIVTAYLQMWESSETGPLLKGLVRSALGSAESSPAIKETLGQHLTRSATTPSTPSLDETSAALLSTQLLGLAIGRYLLELPHLTELSTDEVIEGTAPIVQRYFDGASRTAPGTPPRKQQAQEASTQKLNKQKLDEQEQLALFDGLF